MELQGFVQDCLSGGGGIQKGWGSGGPPADFFLKFQCLKWPILTEMTAKYGIYLHFLCLYFPVSGESPPHLPGENQWQNGRHNVFLLMRPLQM